MPANLPPAYHDAEARFRAAKSTEDKIAALEEMLRIMPKHKGTDKLQADLRARIAKLRRQPARKGPTRSAGHSVAPEGAGQVTLVGPPNTGKSSLVAALTHARPEVAEYPFTTREALPGMMAFKDIAFQLVDLPPVAAEHTEPWLFDLIRRADLVWLVVEVANALDGIRQTRELLAVKHIGLYPVGAPRRETEIEPGWAWKPALVVVTRMDSPDAAADLEIVRELLDEPWPLAPVSAVTREGLAGLARQTFEARGIIRVYTKQPGKPADRAQPFTLPRGATVADLALVIHKDLREQLKFARVWGSQTFEGQSVQRDHVLAEGDIVEIHN